MVGTSIFGHYSCTVLIFFDADVPSLTLRSSPGQGMHVHIQRSKKGQGKLAASARFVKIAETGSTSSFFYQVSHLYLRQATVRRILWPSHGPNWVDK